MATDSPPIGSHVPRRDPLGEAATRGAEVIQVNLSAPRNWAPPAIHGDEDDLAASGMPIFVHAPYLVNPASADPEVRARSRRCLELEAAAAARIGARGLVVHAGQAGAGATPDDAIDRWVETMRGAQLPCRLLLENTAGGDGAPGRTPRDLARLVDALRALGLDVGVVLDTCHAHAAGLDLRTAVGELAGLVGGIDLVHANDSHDPAGSGRDHHQHLGMGQIDPDDLAAATQAAGAPVVVETPGGAAAQAVDLEWLRQRWCSPPERRDPHELQPNDGPP
jgi:deoxyribonuclease-4